MYWDSSYFFDGSEATEGGRLHYNPDDYRPAQQQGLPSGPSGYGAAQAGPQDGEIRTIPIAGTNKVQIQYYNGSEGYWENGNIVDASSAGGGSGVDHYGDVSGNTAATLASNERRDALTQAFNEAEARRDQANLDRDWALSMGDRETARAKQADANHWAGVAAQHDANLEALTARGQDITAQGNAQQFQVGMANVAQAKYDSDQRFQVGMAGAVNDQQRNEIADRWNKEQAAIAKMEDETKRVLGGQQNQVAQFGAETDRAARMGTLALDNNKFIQEMATSPRNLIAHFFTQRGLAPDWNAVINGTPVAQGAALVPSSVMNAYTPTTAPVQFNGTPGNVAAGSVGNAVNSGGVGRNQFIGSSTASAPALAAAGGGGGFAAPPPFQPTRIAAYGGVASAPGVTSSVSSPPAGGNQGASGSYGNSFVQAAPPNATNLGSNPAYQWSDQQQGWINPKNGLMDDGLGHYWNTGTQQWHWIEGDEPYRAMAEGGYTTDRRVLTGDAVSPDPMAGGAKPELIDNPTGAPLYIKNHQQTRDWFRRYGAWPQFPQGNKPSMGRPYRGDLRTPFQPRPVFPGAPNGGQLGTIAGQPLAPPPPQMADRLSAYGQFAAPPAQQYAQAPAPVQIPYGNDSVARQIPYPQQQAGTLPPTRFALGTDNSAAYAAQGMGSAWIPSSQTQYDTNTMPAALRGLASYGFSPPPSLYSAATGQIAPTLNMGLNANNSKIGVLPSLQGLNRMTKGEQGLYRGYAEGVGGIPWDDLTDYISRGTANLQKAAVSRAA